MSLGKQNLVTHAIKVVGISKLTRACGLASRNTIKQWEKSGRVPLDSEVDYPSIIERETNGQVTRAQIWREQLDSLKPGIVYRVPVSLLARDPLQPRKRFNTEHLEELALAMVKDGQQTPIKFSLINGSELIIKHGERRWRSTHIAKMDTVEGILDDENHETDHERILKQIADNIGEPLTVWDWVTTFKQFHDDGIRDQTIASELAARGIKGFSRSVINNYRRLLKLPTSIQDMIASGWLTPSHGKQILLQAKHANIIDELICVLSEQRSEGRNPSLSCIDLEIRDLYAKTYPYIDGQVNEGDEFPFYTPFDETECDGCEYKHTTKLNNGHEDAFCTNTSCYQDKCALVDTTQEQSQSSTSGDQGQGSELSSADTQPGTPPDNEPPQPEQPEPDQVQSDETEQSSDEVMEREQHKKAYKRRVLDAIKAVPVDDIDLILVYSAFSDEQLDDEPTTLKAIASRMQLDSDEMKRAAAVCVVNYLLDSWLMEIGTHLGVTDEVAESSDAENLGLEL
ncbi:MAG: ParB/RepB/Spo0J family partition protein [Candidatus Thiodiazotropha sp. (ex Troendleina suluensis)]|nr:ParB/RepB/Spo0J family partition protein [Candidatus Thiodiazotropha sp. (ex Troendleina suluensis)]